MRSIGKVLGGLGVLIAASSVFTLLASRENLWFAGAKLIVGAALIAVWVISKLGSAPVGPEKPGSDASATKGGLKAAGRAGFFYLTSALTALVLIGALGAVNFITAKRNKTWDLTRKKIYSLAPQTVTALQALKEPVRAVGFLPVSHPAYDAVEQLFKKYAAQSDKFVYEFKDPVRHPELARKYELRQDQTLIILLRGQGEKETHTALNVVSEQELTNALIKLNSVGEQKVYYLVGHGEVPLEDAGAMGGDQQGMNSAAELRKSLVQEGYSPETLNLVEKRELPKDAAALVIAGAKTRLDAAELAAVKKYLDEGGRLLYFAEFGADAGLTEVLASYGVGFDEGVVADDRPDTPSPYAIVTSSFGDHEITRVLKQMQMNVLFLTSRGLTVLKEGLAPGVSPTPVVLTSQYAWVETKPQDAPQLNTGEKSGKIPLVVASTRDTASAENKRFDEGRVVVFGDSELLLDATWGHEPNRNLVLNALGWATQQFSKITIRPPDRDISTVDLDEKTLSAIQFASMDLLPLSLLAIGVAIWLTRRNK